MNECFLTTLPNAVPYLRTNPESRSCKNPEQFFSKSLRIFKSHEKLTVTKPIHPPTMGHSLSPRVHVRSISPFIPSSIQKKPILDDLTLKYLEDSDNNVPSNLEDCLNVRNVLQQLLDFFLSEYNYKDSLMIKKCILKINIEIFKCENQDELNTNLIVKKYLNFWDSEYSQFLEFCKNENSRLESHQRQEIDNFDASLKSDKLPHSPRFSNSARNNRPSNKPLNLSLSLRPSDRSLIVPERSLSTKKKRPRKIDNSKERRDKLIESQKVEINAFIEFSNEIRALLIVLKKSFVSTYLKKDDDEAND